jgi:hypothetical protein
MMLRDIAVAAEQSLRALAAVPPDFLDIEKA